MGSEPAGRSEAGYTLVEVMVTMLIFAIVSTAFYQLLFNVARGTRSAASVSRTSEEARLGLNRMVRDTREGREIESVSTDHNSYNVAVDYNADGVITPWPDSNSSGDYEDLTYSYDSNTEQIRLNGELLMSGVSCIPDGSYASGCKPIFDYSSQRLEFDWDGNGITTWQELDDAASPSHGVVGVGNDNDLLDEAELPFISSVSYNLRVTRGDSSQNFYSRAQLRNNL